MRNYDFNLAEIVLKIANAKINYANLNEIQLIV